MPFYDNVTLWEMMREAPLRTAERAVSVPVVNRHIAALEAGRALAPIRVHLGVILEGSSRYVAGYITGRMPPILRADAPGSTPASRRFTAVVFDLVDMDNAMRASP